MNRLLRYPGAIAGLGLILGLINASFLGWAEFGLFSACLYLMGVAILIQTRFAWKEGNIGLPVTLVVLMGLGSLIYYTGPVTLPGLIVACALPILLTLKKPNASSFEFTAPSARHAVLMIGLIILGATYATLSQFAFAQSLRSPWDAVAPIFVLLPFAVLCVIVIADQFKHRTPQLPLLFITLLLVLMVTPVLYKLGYGFDPFIHRATLNHIIEHGTITPKPLYYIGQYALELIGTRVFGIPLFGLDIWLVPILASLLLPLIALRIAQEQRYGILFLLLIPLSPFIFTTPQSLSYLFFGLTIAGLCLNPRTTWHLASFDFPIFAWLMAFGTLIIHPLSGIPAICITLVGTLAPYTTTLRKVLFALTLLGTVFAIPTLFLLQSGSLSIHLHAAEGFSLHLADFTNHFSGWIDALYAFPRISLLIFASLIVIGLYTLKEKSLAYWSFGGGLALLVSYFLLSSFFEFSFLVTSERANYANRLPYLALLTFLPLLITGLHQLVNYVSKRPLAIPAFTLCLTLFATSNAYASFPRNDGETRSAGFNVSALDYQAVGSIHNLYEMGSYTVLADQSLSAAALSEYGFAQYFHGDTFYYPIPTGGPLYQLYLDMSGSKTGVETAKKAAELTGASHVVFVSHNYWSGSEAARERAKQDASNWYTIGDRGEIMIFLYDFEAP